MRILFRCPVLRAEVVVASQCKIGATTLVATGGLLPFAHHLVVCGIVENVIDIECRSKLP